MYDYPQRRAFSRAQPLKIAINGYGRIGRCVLRAIYESGLQDQIQVVAINEPADLESMIYLSRYDSTHGVFPQTIEPSARGMRIGAHEIIISHASKPQDLAWQELGLDMIFECSGKYTSRAQLEDFAPYCGRTLVSNPGQSAADLDATIVFGFNHQDLHKNMRLVSAASCTTNASVPVLDILHQSLVVESAFITTLHSVMNDQPMIDGYHHTDLRRTRSAMQSMVPVSTGLALGIERLLPELAGKIQAKAVRVPILNVSAIDLSINLAQATTAGDLNALLQSAANQRPGLLSCTDKPHASIDFNHNPHSAILDLGLTRVNNGRFANLLVWFDNEWGFANRMLDVALAWAESPP